MSNPDWREAPEGATHYDCNADVFCTVDGYWSCKGKYYHMPCQMAWGSERYTPRPVEPATTAWDGTGLPPVGSDQTVFVPSTAISAVGELNSDSRWEVVAHRGDSVVVCIDEYGLGVYRASMVPARYCRHIPTQAQRERQEATDFAARAYLSDRVESAPNLSGEQARKIAAFFYDAKMLKLPEGYRLER